MTLQNALMCLALNIYHEARGESLDGKIGHHLANHPNAWHIVDDHLDGDADCSRRC